MAIDKFVDGQVLTADELNRIITSVRAALDSHEPVSPIFTTNYLGIFRTATDLPANRVGAAWALVGTDATSLTLYVLADMSSTWVAYPNKYNIANFDTVVRYNAQTLNDSQKEQARTNIDAASFLDMLKVMNETIGSWETKVPLTAGSNHSSMSDIIRLLAKAGDTIRIYFSQGTSTTTFGQFFLRDASTAEVYKQTINNGATVTYTVPSDVYIAGIYVAGTAITKSGDAVFRVEIANKGLQKDENIRSSIQAIILGLNSLPVLDTTKHSITFPKNTIIYADGEMYMTPDEYEVSYVMSKATASSNRILAWNVLDKLFHMREYNVMSKGDRVVGTLKCGYGTATNLVNYYFPFSYVEVSGDTPKVETTNRTSVYAVWLASETLPDIDTNEETVTFPSDSWFAIDDSLIRPTNWSIKYVVEDDGSTLNKTFSSVRLVCLNMDKFVPSTTQSSSMKKYDSDVSNVTLELVAYDRIKPYHRIVGIMRCAYGVGHGFHRADFPFEYSINGESVYGKKDGSDTDSLPSYYKSEYEMTRKTVESHQMMSTDTFTIGFMTDLHYAPDNYKEGVFKTMSAMARMSRELNFSLVALGGDYQQLNAYSADSMGESAYRQLGIDCITDAMRGISECDAPSAVLMGNHELHYSGVSTDVGLTEAQFTQICSKKYASRARTLMKDGNWYMDDPTNNVRYIFINSISAYGNEAVPESVRTWLNEITHTDLDIVVLCHFGVSHYGEGMNTYTTAVSAINAMHKKPILWICGHNHADCHKVFGTTLIVSCLHSSQLSGGVSEDGINYTHAIGTATESAFTAITVDRTHKKVYCDRFGLGKDREYSLL